jgi:murein DD-endopeptidase MepM/ murein hydrolase activator NlpD
MPTVPVIDQTAMPAEQYNAGGVTPMHNYAPQQLAASGAALTNAGDTALSIGRTIGDKIQAQVDDARVKTAEAAALSQAQQINYDPQTGFLNQRGQNAMDQYKPATAAVAKAFSDQAENLDNPIQQFMFKQVQNHHLLTIGQTMSNHAFQQTSQYSGEAAVSRANSFALAASNSSSSYGQVDADGNATGEFSKNLATAEQETLKAAEIFKGAPPNSAVANEALLKLHTQVGTAAVQQMMDGRAPFSKVKGVFEDMKAKGFLTLQAEDSLGKMVKTYSEQEMTRSAVNDSLSNAYRSSQGQPTTSTGTPDYDFAIKGATITAQAYNPEDGGVYVPINANSKIQAPADGKVVQVGKNEDGNFSVGIQHENGSVTTFTGLTASNVKVGDTVQRGEDVATSGQLEGSSSPSVLWSLADKDGNNIDPTRAGLGPVDVTRITDEKVLSDALNRVRTKITDPYLQQQATSEMESIVRHNQQMQNAAQVQVHKQVSDIYYQNNMNWRAVPPSLFNQLPAEQQHEFKTKQQEEAMRQFSMGQFWRNANETDIVSDFYSNPRQITTDNVEAARGQLSNSTYLQLMNRAQELQKNPDGVIQAENVNERLKFYAGPAGVDVNPTSPSGKATLNQLQFQVQQQIDQVKEQNHGKATPEQVNKIIQDQVIQRTLTTPRSPWNPLALFSPNAEKNKFVFQIPGAGPQPQVNDIKTFPNGSKGKWDGQGWVALP